VVNKADRDGALRMVSELEQMLHPAAAVPVDDSSAADDGVDRQAGSTRCSTRLERHRAFVATDAERAGRTAARRAGEADPTSSRRRCAGA
jgi:hypothetical protein